MALKNEISRKKARKKLAYGKAELQLAYDLLKEQIKRFQSKNERLLINFSSSIDRSFQIEFYLE